MDSSPDWPTLATRLGARLPRGRAAPEVVAWEERAPGGRRGVACSGGADSVALLLWRWAHYPEGRAHLVVLHFDHDLRGEESAADAAFVESLAVGLGLPCRVGRWSRPAGWPGPSEAESRGARLEFLAQVAARENLVAIYTGHQRDDLLESMLMRLARGSGPAGLAAPRPVQVWREGPVRLRPLLDCGREEIREALRGAGVPWREDSSNADAGPTRNRLRQAVLPLLREVLPHRPEPGAALSRRRCAEDDEALEEWLRRLDLPLAPGRPFPVAALAGYPMALWRRAWWEWLRQQDLTEAWDRPLREDLLEAVRAGRPCRIEVSGGRWEIEPGGWRWQPSGPAASWPESDLAVGAILPGPAGATLRAALLEDVPERLAEVRAGRADPAREAFLTVPAGPPPGWPPLRVRAWRPGDRYHPLGGPGRRKLQDLFTDRRVPVGERARRPVVCWIDDAIVWVPGYPPAHSCRLAEGARRALHLTYQPPSTESPL